jgi:hypothetical protein
MRQVARPDVAGENLFACYFVDAVDPVFQGRVATVPDRRVEPAIIEQRRIGAASKRREINGDAADETCARPGAARGASRPLLEPLGVNDECVP